MEYQEEEFLQLSGIQHFIFCRRQWALIHIEKQWEENGLTMDGTFFHKNAHNAQSREKRGGILIARGAYIHSRKLGLSGQCDIVEFHRCEEGQDAEGVPIHDMDGLWKPYPIEYKRGRVKPTRCDEAQVCAQAMCLEEMYCCGIASGAIFYGENRRRYEVLFDEALRQQVRDAVREMHDLYRRGRTPGAKRQKGCSSCSMANLCMPTLSETETVEAYLNRMMCL